MELIQPGWDLLGAQAEELDGQGNAGAGLPVQRIDAGARPVPQLLDQSGVEPCGLENPLEQGFQHHQRMGAARRRLGDEREIDLQPGEPLQVGGIKQGNHVVAS